MDSTVTKSFAQGLDPGSFRSPLRVYSENASTLGPGVPRYPSSSRRTKDAGLAALDAVYTEIDFASIVLSNGIPTLAALLPFGQTGSPLPPSQAR
jgi:hypothetical protein